MLPVYRAVVRWIDSGLSVVLPAKGIGLSPLTFYQIGLTQREHAQGISRSPAGESLAGIVGRSSERVPNSDIAQAVYGRTRHPSVETFRCVGALLEQLNIALRVQPEFVPADSAARCGCIY